MNEKNGLIRIRMNEMRERKKKSVPKVDQYYQSKRVLHVLHEGDIIHRLQVTSMVSLLLNYRFLFISMDIFDLVDFSLENR